MNVVVFFYPMLSGSEIIKLALPDCLHWNNGIGEHYMQ